MDSCSVCITTSSIYNKIVNHSALQEDGKKPNHSALLALRYYLKKDERFFGPELHHFSFLFCLVLERAHEPSIFADDQPVTLVNFPPHERSGSEATTFKSHCLSDEKISCTDVKISSTMW
jgi:hypothetical protein